MAPVEGSIVDALRQAKQELVDELAARLEVALIAADALDKAFNSLKKPTHKKAAPAIRAQLHLVLSAALTSSQTTGRTSPPPAYQPNTTPNTQDRAKPGRAQPRDVSTPPPAGPLANGKTTRWAEVVTRPPKHGTEDLAQPPLDNASRQGSQQHSRPTAQGKKPRTNNPDQPQSRRVFLRLSASDSLRSVTPEAAIAFLVERTKFPREQIRRAYPVSSGVCFETNKPDQRQALAKLAETAELTIELEEMTYAYALNGVPRTYTMPDGQQRDTAALIHKEVEVATRQKAKVFTKDADKGDHIIILKKPSRYPIRIFGSEPARPLERKPRINTCDRCFGHHHTTKCGHAAVCHKCGTPTASHGDTCKLVPQCPNCLGPHRPGHDDCAAAPKVSKGKVQKPTSEQRTGLRRVGKAAYRAALKERKKSGSMEVDSPDTPPHPQHTTPKTTPATPADTPAPRKGHRFDAAEAAASARAVNLGKDRAKVAAAGETRLQAIEVALKRLPLPTIILGVGELLGRHVPGEEINTWLNKGTPVDAKMDNKRLATDMAENRADAVFAAVRSGCSPAEIRAFWLGAREDFSKTAGEITQLLSAMRPTQATAPARNA